MYHVACWERLLSEGRSFPDPVDGFRQIEVPSRCPNCRGAGTLIAVWPFVDTSLVTQVVNGQPVVNELDENADQFNITAPDVQTPPTPPINYTSHRGPVFYAAPSYPIQTNLVDGRPSIIVDPGSVGNLCGDKWAREVAKMAAHNGHKPSYEKRPRPLKVCGVGNGSQECQYDCTLPVAVRPESNNQANIGNLTIPAVSNSDLPGLLGLTALRKNRAILDFNTLRLYFCGPGDYDLDKETPPGTDTYQLEIAPSGHIVLPCCEFEEASVSSQHSLTLLTNDGSQNRNDGSSASSSSRKRPGATAAALDASSSASRVQPPQVRHITALAGSVRTR